MLANLMRNIFDYEKYHNNSFFKALIIGDSILKHACSTLRQNRVRRTDFNDSFKEVRCECVGGEGISAMVSRVGRHRADSSIATVILCVGTNDIMRDYSREHFRDLYFQLLSIVSVKFPSAIIFCCHILPRKDDQSFNYRHKIDDYNTAIDDMVTPFKATAIKVSPYFRVKKHLTHKDFLHLNFDGLEFIRKVIKDSIISFRQNNRVKGSMFSLLDGLSYSEDVLPAHLKKAAWNLLTGDNYKFMSQGSTSSSILLFGREKYVYNAASFRLNPI